MSGRTLTIWASLILSTYHVCVCELLNCRSEHVHSKIACYFRPQGWQGNGYVSNLPRRLVNAKLMDKISAQAFDVKTDLDHHPFQSCSERNMQCFPPKPWFRLCMRFWIYIYWYYWNVYYILYMYTYYVYIYILYVIYIIIYIICFIAI